MKTRIFTLALVTLCFQGLNAQKSDNLATGRDADDLQRLKEYFEKQENQASDAFLLELPAFKSGKVNEFPREMRPKPGNGTELQEEGSPEHEFLYKSSGTAKRALLDSITYYKYSNDLDSLAQSKSLFFHDDRGKRFRGEYYMFHASSGLWMKDYAWEGKNHSEYHTEAGSNWWRLITYYQPHPETGEWVPDYRYIDDQDKNENKTLDITEFYDLEREEWIRIQHTESSFDENNRLTSFTRWEFDWDSGEIVGGFKDKFERNGNGQVILSDNYRFDPETGDWYHSGEFRMTYQMEYMTSRNIYERPYKDGELMHVQSDSSYYDSENRLYREVLYSYDSQYGLMGNQASNWKYNSGGYDEIRTRFYYEPDMGWIISNITAYSKVLDQESGVLRTSHFNLNENMEVIAEIAMSDKEFDEMGRPIRETHYVKDGESGNWVPEIQIIREWSATMEHMTHDEYRVWDLAMNDWFTTYLQRYTNKGLMLESKFFEINWNDGSYVGRYWREWQYDQMDRITHYKSLGWDRALNNWGGGYSQYTYSDDGTWKTWEYFRLNTESGEYWHRSNSRMDYNEFGQDLLYTYWNRESAEEEFMLASKEGYYYSRHLSLHNRKNQPVSEFLDVIVGENTITVSIPESLLSRTDRDKITDFVVSLSNGDELPGWIRFDLESFSFIIDPYVEKSTLEDSAMHVYLNLLDEDSNSIIFVFSFTEEIRETEVTGIEDSTVITGMRLYPNPARDVLYLETAPLEKGSPYRLMIIDASGRTVHLQELHSTEGRTTIAVGHLSSGIYHLVLESTSKGIQKGATLLIE